MVLVLRERLPPPLTQAAVFLEALVRLGAPLQVLTTPWAVVGLELVAVRLEMLSLAGVLEGGLIKAGLRDLPEAVLYTAAVEAAQAVD